jgi:hypothetical protein
MPLSALLDWLRHHFSTTRSRTAERTRQRRFRPSVEALEERTVPTVNDVGTGQAYQTIGAVPWGQLAPGDDVRIHWQPQAYHEMILLSQSGTASAPITVEGIAGPNGQLPVIDGQNATMSSQLHYAYSGSATSPGTPNRGVVVVSPAAGYTWGYKPSYIDISGLDIRNASPANTFTDNTGAVRAYSANAASIFVERGENITISNCTITGSGNGLFVASGGSEQLQSREILVQGCYIYGNGNAGSDRQHNVYTEAIGITFQYNHFGPLTAGSLGSNLKDRSAGTVIRYNLIDGGAHLLDLVNPQDSAPQATQDPNFHQTYVYGNILVNGVDAPVSALMIHYGGDDGNTATYRKGTLYFYNNTVVVQANQSTSWRVVLFQLETNDESVDARNNIVYCGPATAGATKTELTLMNTAGNATFGVNWVSPGWVASRSRVPFTGTISGTGNFISNTANNPGFINLAGGDYHLAAGSQAIDAGTAQASGVSETYAVTEQYQAPQTETARTVQGKAIDLGAFEYVVLGSAGTLQFDASSYTANAQWANTVQIPVVRRVTSQGAVSVDFLVTQTTSSGIVTIASGTLNFSSGQYTGWITLSLPKLAAGSSVEWDLTLSNPTGGAALGAISSAKLTISG